MWKKGNPYPHVKLSGDGMGYEDLENRSLEPRYRMYVPASRERIHIGSHEILPHGTLRCFMRRGLAVVGLYRDRETVGYELVYRPTREEIRNGIPEWKFDMQNTSVFGEDWNYQDTNTFFWTVRGLRKDGKPEALIAA